MAGSCGYFKAVETLNAHEALATDHSDGALALGRRYRDPLGTAGVELISDNAASAGGGRGVRLKRAAS